MDVKIRDAILKDEPASLSLAIEDLRKEFPKNEDTEEKILGCMLQQACQHNAMNCAAFLLNEELAFKTSLLHVRDKKGRTPLHIAAEANSPNCIDVLIVAGANANIRLIGANRLLPIESALISRSDEVNWSLEKPMEELVIFLKSMDLEAVKLLVDKTEGVEEMALRYAMEGSLVELGMLLVALNFDGIRAERLYNFVWNKLLPIPVASTPYGGERRQSLLQVVQLLVQLSLSLSAHNIDKNPTKESFSTDFLKEHKIVKAMGIISGVVAKDDTQLLTSAVESFRKEAQGWLCGDIFKMIEQQMFKWLLQLSYKHDAVGCATFLLEGAKRITALPVDPAIELEIALASARNQVEWSFEDSVVDLIILLNKKDIKVVRLLSEMTEEIGDMAYKLAIDGRVIELAILFLVDKLQPKITIRAKRPCSAWSSYLTNWGPSSSNDNDKRNDPPLCRAAKALDASLIKMLLMGKGDPDFNKAWKAVQTDDTKKLTEAILKFRTNYRGKLRKGSPASTLLYEEMSTRLLHLACKDDAVECAKLLLEGDKDVTAAPVDAEDHLGWTPLHFAADMLSTSCIDLLLKRNARTDMLSTSCIDLLLKRNARTDLKLVKGRPLLALEMALMSARIENIWKLDHPIEDLLLRLKDKGVHDVVRPLAEKTREVWDVAHKYAFEGHVIALGMLLLVIEDKIATPVSVDINGVQKMKSLYDLIVDEAVSDDCSKERRKILRSEIQLLQNAKVGSTNVTEILPVEDVRLPPKLAKKRLTIEAYFSQPKKNMVETLMSDGNICAEMKTEACQYINQLVRLFTLAFSSNRCWQGNFMWDDFEIVDGKVRCVKWARNSLTSLGKAADLDILIKFIEKCFKSDNPNLISPFPAYLDEFLELLRNQKVCTSFTSKDRLRIESHPFLMESYQRLVLMIMLKRKFEGANQDEKAKWILVMTKLKVPDNWDDLNNVAVFKDVIAQAIADGRPHHKTPFGTFRLMRDYSIHALDHRCKKLGTCIIEYFKDNNGIELMVPFHFKFLASLIEGLVTCNVDILYPF